LGDFLPAREVEVQLSKSRFGDVELLINGSRNLNEAIGR
jgi:hypothetical protein